MPMLGIALPTLVALAEVAARPPPNVVVFFAVQFIPFRSSFPIIYINDNVCILRTD